MPLTCNSGTSNSDFFEIMGVLGGAHSQGTPSFFTYVVIDLDLVQVEIPHVPGPSCCQAKRLNQPARRWALFQSFPPQGDGIYRRQQSDRQHKKICDCPTSIPSSSSLPVTTTFFTIREKFDSWKATDSNRTREVGERFIHLATGR